MGARSLSVTGGADDAVDADAAVCTAASHSKDVKCQHPKQRCTPRYKGPTSDRLGGGGIGGGDGKPEAEEEAWPL